MEHPQRVFLVPGERSGLTALRAALIEAGYPLELPTLDAAFQL